MASTTLYIALQLLNYLKIFVIKMCFYVYIKSLQKTGITNKITAFEHFSQLIILETLHSLLTISIIRLLYNNGLYRVTYRATQSFL